MAGLSTDLATGKLLKCPTVTSPKRICRIRNRPATSSLGGPSLAHNRCWKPDLPRREILTRLATAAEVLSGPGSAVSILVLDENGLLRNGASPNLPSDYLDAIDRLKPDARIGTCAAAAATGYGGRHTRFLRGRKVGGASPPARGTGFCRRLEYADQVDRGKSARHLRHVLSQSATPHGRRAQQRRTSRGHGRTRSCPARWRRSDAALKAASLPHGTRCAAAAGMALSVRHIPRQNYFGLSRLSATGRSIISSTQVEAIDHVDLK